MTTRDTFLIIVVDNVFDMYQHMEMAKALWDALAEMYKREDSGEKWRKGVSGEKALAFQIH